MSGAAPFRFLFFLPSIFLARRASQFEFNSRNLQLNNMTDISNRRSNLSIAKRSLLEQRLRGINRVPAEKSDIRLRAKQGSAPLSFAQQRLWFLDQLVPNNPFYNCSNAARLEGRLDLEVFERVINEIVRRHEVLRTRFDVAAGGPIQVIDEWKPLKLEVADLTCLAMEEKEA